MRAFLVFCCALVLASSAGAYSTDPVIAETASWLAMRDVEVRCLTKQETAEDVTITFWGASAYVPFTWENGKGVPADYTVFEYGLCEQLKALYTNTWQGVFTPRQLGWAVLVIAHESKHLRGGKGWMNEGPVNRWALKHTRYTALHLGASEELSWQLRDHAIVWCKNQPPQYQRLGCDLPPRP